MELDTGVVIAVGNQKGGVGKTTNTVHIAAALGLFGFRSLIIDLDPSAGATKHLVMLENLTIPMNVSVSRPATVPKKGTRPNAWGASRAGWEKDKV
jgi:cellulose biosynthesis protein BcsQ